MKLTNILVVISIFFALSACSMEDDTVMNDVDKEIQNNIDAYASFDLALNSGNVATKASATEGDAVGPNEKENRVSNCYLAVFNYTSGELLASYFYKGGEENDITPTAQGNYTLNTHLSFKVFKNEKPKLRFVAITNVQSTVDPAYGDVASLGSLQACTTYNELMGATLQEDPYALIKVGETELEANNYQTSSSLAQNHEDFCKSVIIPVYQRTASVELAKFVVKKRNGSVDTEVGVSDVKVQLQLMNIKTTVKSGSASEILAIGEERVNALAWSSKDTEASRMYTYANSDQSNKTRLKIAYKLNGEQKYAYYTIKSPAANQSYTEEVKANTLYKLDVTIINEVVNVVIKCYTKDWINGGSLWEGEMSEQKN